MERFSHAGSRACQLPCSPLLSKGCIVLLADRLPNIGKTRVKALVNATAVLKRVGVTLAFFACSGCATSVPPTGYPECSIRPGTYACQIEQYEKVNE